MRRTFLFGGAAALSILTLATPARASAGRRLALRHAATGARFEGVWHDGRAPDPGAMRELSLALADPGCEPPLPFEPDTIALVWEVAARTRLGDLDIRSGYRTPQVNRRVHGAGDSLHIRASAVDLGVPRGRLAAVAETALSLGRGGVGVYARRAFVHLDTGSVRSWSDAGQLDLGDDPVARVARAWTQGTR